ncbi:MAG: DUF2249 domain-containing protein [Thermoleophilia bacterium]|nr:DUF2249 domain-containing protein [Thermoleophilia bacterium]
MAGETVRLDVREMPPWERRPKIFEILDRLGPGDELELVNDHDPRPLRYELMHEREGQFDFHSGERGPREWVAHIKRAA